MNIIQSVTSRIESYRKENKNPCKNYATEAAAEKAVAKIAKMWVSITCLTIQQITLCFLTKHGADGTLRLIWMELSLTLNVLVAISA